MELLQTRDQTWTAGNLALQDSLRQQVPVRVVRGSHEKIKYAIALHVGTYRYARAVLCCAVLCCAVLGWAGLCCAFAPALTAIAAAKPVLP